ncbi:MAG: TlpA family protein disulfide reductase [Deltaproteobacteria bacterium]|nr:TlpA family protein disulfide reductase [Deltaproteobacteria bacterium]
MRALLLAACLLAPGVAAAAGGTVHDVLFKTLDGRSTTLRPHKGRVVVVHVFTTWDVPGLRQVADLRALAQQRNKEVSVVGIGLDLEGALALTSFERTLKPGYPLWMPDGTFLEGRTPFGRPQEVPRVYVVGRDGTVRQGFVGYVPYADLLRMVDEELRR